MFGDRKDSKDGVGNECCSFGGMSMVTLVDVIRNTLVESKIGVVTRTEREYIFMTR